ncbi:hypothetical protein K505DRAFT_341243 [Melanomma pulvis-pyrius CBS 109.77]|uniref:Uncharacterized protein n=1 Tax=Melanomma pulvis-pyrius CBS 109.77 TaxID=1314802 RepID=A0A6A6WZU7_9PLEO|nr:hypothetical protein K505DRAFT_341243 [Melanomma pulvis-pyrius CBS 109.77]
MSASLGDRTPAEQDFFAKFHEADPKYFSVVKHVEALIDPWANVQIYCLDTAQRTSFSTLEDFIGRIGLRRRGRHVCHRQNHPRFPRASTIELQANGYGAVRFKSKCTKEYFISYLKSGTVPPQNVVCPSEQLNPVLE